MYKRQVLIGEREEGELPLDKTQEIESLLLTKKDMINKQLGALNLQKNFGCTAVSYTHLDVYKRQEFDEWIVVGFRDASLLYGLEVDESYFGSAEPGIPYG